MVHGDAESAFVEKRVGILATAWAFLNLAKAVEQTALGIQMSRIRHVWNGGKGFVHQINLNIEHEIRSGLERHRGVVGNTQAHSRVDGGGIDGTRNARAHRLLFRRASAGLARVGRQLALAARVEGSGKTALLAKLAHVDKAGEEKRREEKRRE